MKLLYICILFLFVSCASETSKQDYIIEFSSFVKNLEQQKRSNTQIDWSTKNDSLDQFINRQNEFRLTRKDKQTIDELIETSNSIISSQPDIEMLVHFYFENSLSMNGYLDGLNFKQSMHRMFSGIDEGTLNTYFVNTQEYEAKDLLSKIDAKQIATQGINASDHQFIFTNAIEKAVENNLSIVVTDGIYSVKDGDIGIVEIDIENAFKKALTDNEIETLVLKMYSEFNGTYYSETCEPGNKAIPISNQVRPYYILMFGNSKSIDKALNEIAIINELPGFEQQSRFFLTKSLNVDYSVLTQGEEKHGEFVPSSRGSNIITEIKNAKKYERRGFKGTPKEENYLQFAIAVDFSKTPLPDSYVEDVSNYLMDDELGYKIVEIQSIENLIKTSKTYKSIGQFKKKSNTSFTHIITVKADKDLYGSMHLKLQNNLPSWISETGIEDDCKITGDTTHTFAFDKLMIGILKAYKKVTKSDHYLNIDLKINAN